MLAIRDLNGSAKRWRIKYILQVIKTATATGLGVNVIWLNPVFVSGWFDGGYDIIDFYKVDPRFGTNTDLVKLIDEAHKRGIRVLLDLVAGHSSDQCQWFKESAQGTDMRYSDYYIWSNEIPQKEVKIIAERKLEAQP